MVTTKTAKVNKDCESAGNVNLPSESLLKLYRAVGAQEYCGLLGWKYIHPKRVEVPVRGVYSTLKQLHQTAQKLGFVLSPRNENSQMPDGKLLWENMFTSCVRDDVPYYLAASLELDENSF